MGLGYPMRVSDFGIGNINGGFHSSFFCIAVAVFMDHRGGSMLPTSQSEAMKA